MRIATINGLRTEDGSAQYSGDPIFFGEYEKVEMVVKAGLNEFDTYDFKGLIDFCDATPTTKITTRTKHVFAYPSGYTPETVKKKDEDDNEVETTKHKVVLYFSKDVDYGYIDGQLLSQVDELTTPFPDFVFFNGWYSEYDQSGNPPNFDPEDEYQRRKDVLLIMNKDFKAPAGITKNLSSQPIFYSNLPKMEYFGKNYPGGYVVSTFETMPKIYNDLSKATIFPMNPEGELAINAYNPLKHVDNKEDYLQGMYWENLKKIENQGEFKAIETLFGFSLDCNSPHLTIKDKLTALPKGGAPKHVYNSYNVEPYVQKTGHAVEDYIMTGYTPLSELVDTHKFFAADNLETLVNCFNIPLRFDKPEKEFDDPLPLGPDYSKSPLKALQLPSIRFSAGVSNNNMAVGSKLFFWELPNTLEVVRGTHQFYYPDEYYGDDDGSIPANTIVATYGWYREQANVKKTKNRDIQDDEQVISYPLHNGVRDVYGYYHDNFHPLYEYDKEEGVYKNFTYDPLPETVQIVEGYCCFNVRQLGDDAFIIPGLPSAVKYVSGYCSSMFEDFLYSVGTSFTGAPRIELEHMDNITLEENKCSNLISVDDWMNKTYKKSNIDISYRTDKLIRPLPTLAANGKSFRTFQEAFKVMSRTWQIETSTYQEFPINEEISFEYSNFENRSIAISAILPYLSNLSGNNHEDAYYKAFNGEYAGNAETLGALTDVDTEDVWDINDGYEVYRDLHYPKPEPLNEHQARILNRELKHGKLYYGGQEVWMENDIL